MVMIAEWRQIQPLVSGKVGLEYVLVILLLILFSFVIRRAGVVTISHSRDRDRSKATATYHKMRKGTKEKHIGYLGFDNDKLHRN